MGGRSSIFWGTPKASHSVKGMRTEFANPVHQYQQIPVALARDLVRVHNNTLFQDFPRGQEPDGNMAKWQPKEALADYLMVTKL